MNLKEFSIHGVLAALGTFATSWLGGWDIALKLLIIAMIGDYVTGLLAAWRNKKLNSDVMFWGGIRKATILFIVLLAVLFDQMVNDSNPVFRTLAIIFYISREGLSITENMGHYGMNLPPFLKDVLEQLNKKAGGDETDQKKE